MRKIAFLFIIIFTFVQFVPVVSSAGQKVITFFVDMDEQSEESPKMNDALEKKEYDHQIDITSSSVKRQGVETLFAVNIIPAPILEKPTPPPNFSSLLP